MRSINVHHWIKIWSDRNLKTGGFDSLSGRWNYDTLVAALIHIFLAKILLKIAWIHSPAKKRLRHSKQKLAMPASSEWLKITGKYKYLKPTFRLLEEVVRETKAQSVVPSRSQVTLFFPMKGTIHYDLKVFLIPLLKGIVLMLGSTQLG